MGLWIDGVSLMNASPQYQAPALTLTLDEAHIQQNMHVSVLSLLVCPSAPPVPCSSTQSETQTHIVFCVAVLHCGGDLS